MTVDGTCEPRFAEVQEEFERNLAERSERGASVCVTLDGETVVDLWGGEADADAGRGWEKDTVVAIWSSGKGVTSLCAHVLASRGELDFEAPVTRYWPEFGNHGKADAPVRLLLTQQMGLPAFREPLPPDGYLDWDLVVERLEAEEPHWAPGTRVGYHALTFGHLVGEVVRRISGRTVGQFLQEEIAGPLGLDLWIGLPEEHAHRVATLSAADLDPAAPLPAFYEAALTDPTSIPHLVMMNSGGLLDPGMTNDARFHAAEIPTATAMANGRALAGLYRPLALGGEVDGVRLVDEASLAAMSSVSAATDVDATMGVPTRWTLGFMPSLDNRRRGPGREDSVIMSGDAFGYSGAGGSLGFADPQARLSFGYAMNHQGTSTGLNPRGQSLVNATYRALGYHQPDGAPWLPA